MDSSFSSLYYPSTTTTTPSRASSVSTASDLKRHLQPPLTRLPDKQHSTSRLLPPRSPHVSHRSSPVNGVAGSPNTLPRSPGSARAARKLYTKQLHSENDRLCDSVSDGYMVRIIQPSTLSLYRIKSLHRKPFQLFSIYQFQLACLSWSVMVAFCTDLPTSC